MNALPFSRQRPLAALISGLALSSLALAADTGGALEEILVTATKTGARDLQSTALPITALDQNYLEARGVTDVIGMANFTPGLQISDVNGNAQLYLRGIGCNSVFIDSDHSTTIHIDGVYMARPMAYFTEVIDIKRIEILRAPQGTLYERHDVGGTINVISRRPSEEFTAELRGTAGSYSQRNLEAMVSGPILADRVLGSLTYGRWRRDGYLDNVGSGSNFEDQDAYAFRGQLYFDLGERLDLTLRADYHRSDENKGGLSKLMEPIGSPLEDSILRKQWKVANNSPNKRAVKSRGLAAELNYLLTDEVELKSLTSYRDLETDNLVDGDATNVDIMRSHMDLEQHQFSQELNLTAHLDALTLIGGLYYFREVDREPASILMPESPMGPVAHFQRPKLTAESYALFGEAEYRFSTEWSLVAGARYTSESKRYGIHDFLTASNATDIGSALQAPVLGGFEISSKKRYHAWTPKLALQYQPSDDLMLYASATRGFKSGGLDFGSSTPEDQKRGYAPEYLWSYELGMKSQWLEDRLRVNATAFFYDYKDLQVTLYKDNINAITRNAATAEVKGLELELTGRPHPQLDLYATLAYLDARYKKYRGASNKRFGEFDASGQKLNNAPRWSTLVGARFALPTASMGEFYVGADVHYRSTQYFSPANQGLYGVSNYKAQQGDYALWQARVGWHSPDDRWHASLIGQNLTGTKYITAAADYGGLDHQTIIARSGAPRMLSAQLSWRYLARSARLACAGRASMSTPSLASLFFDDRLGQVAGLIDVGALEHRHMVG